MRFFDSLMGEIHQNSPITDQSQTTCGFECDASRMMNCVGPEYTVVRYMHLPHYVVSQTLEIEKQPTLN